MVLLNGNKYACETCIKGHRSSTCRHTDRPLFEIKKKGRPVTQCEHCRELRKTKQVHVKCSCEAKEEHVPTQSSGIKKGHTKVPDSATFPLGLPEALGASAALQASSEGTSSDSDHGGTRNGCSCKTGGPCHCCTARRSAPRNRRRDAPRPPQAGTGSHDAPAPFARTPSHILARLAELRPVLPRPSHNHRPNTGPSHNLSSGIAHGHTVRHHSHENLLFSPYGRAYDYTHEQAYDEAQNYNSSPQNPTQMSPTPLFSTDEQIFRDQLRALEAAVATPWVPPSGSSSELSFPSACGCGDNCRCPGCVQHNGPNATPSPSAFSSCMNPGVCTTCLDCTILSLPASLPPDTSLSISDAYQLGSIDEWIRQVSSLPRSSPVNGSSSEVDITGFRQTQQQSAWDGYLPPIVEPASNPGGVYMVQSCCGVLCKCVPENCKCDIQSENGYDCRNEILLPTFATSSDRALSHHRGSLSVDSGSTVPYGSMRDCSENGLYLNSGQVTEGSYLTVPEPPRSRSSSSSSQSSHGQPGQHRQRPPFSGPPISNDYSFAGGRGHHVRGPFTFPGSMSSPNLGLKLQTGFSDSLSSSSSPSSISPTPSLYQKGSVSYAVSNPDSDGYVSDDRHPRGLRRPG